MKRGAIGYTMTEIFAGKYCGVPLKDANPEYLAHILHAVEDLPPEVAQFFRERLESSS